MNKGKTNFLSSMAIGSLQHKDLLLTKYEYFDLVLADRYVC